MEVKRSSFHVCTTFGKKLYINCGSVLRAARLKRIDFYLDTREYQCTYDVAGFGIIEEEMFSSGGNYRVRNLTVFDSIESFKEKRSFGRDLRGFLLPDAVFPGLELTTDEILKNAFASIANVRFDEKAYAHYVERYKWNGVKTENVGIEGSVWLDEEGFHTNAKIPAGTYLTKEECEEANQISVIEFEDEE